MDRVAFFMRQLVHDVGNDLGALDLQAAYLAELLGGAPERGEMERLRLLARTIAKNLQSVTAHLDTPQVRPQRRLVSNYLDGLRRELASRYPRESCRLSWEIVLGAERFSVDPELLVPAMAELCLNACEFHQSDSPVNVRARVESGWLIWELSQWTPQVSGSPGSWGMVPFESARRGHYGLGLFSARRVLAAHGGRLQFLPEPGTGSLVTRLSLPLDETADGGLQAQGLLSTKRLK